MLRPAAENLKLTWDAATKSCSGALGYDVRVLTSKLGFESQLQDYVLAVQIKEIKQKWSFVQALAATKQVFNPVVQVSYHSVEPLRLLDI